MFEVRPLDGQTSKILLRQLTAQNAGEESPFARILGFQFTQLHSFSAECAGENTNALTILQNFKDRSGFTFYISG